MLMERAGVAQWFCFLVTFQHSFNTGLHWKLAVPETNSNHSEASTCHMDQGQQSCLCRPSMIPFFEWASPLRCPEVSWFQDGRLADVLSPVLCHWSAFSEQSEVWSMMAIVPQGHQHFFFQLLNKKSGHKMFKIRWLQRLLGSYLVLKILFMDYSIQH